MVRAQPFPALGLIRVWQAGLPPLACEWGSWPLLPVCTHLRFQVWAPTPLIWVCATRLQVSTLAAFPAFTVQGLRGEGRQRLWLLLRVL